MVESAFVVGDQIVSPEHGVGKITAASENIVMGEKIKMYDITLIRHDKLVLRIPCSRVNSIRHISSKETLNEALDILTQDPKTTKGMWSKRQVEYLEKITSGDLLLLAEVLRDLYRKDENRSYSERAIYETAIERFVDEYSLIAKIPTVDAQTNLLSILDNRLLEVI